MSRMEVALLAVLCMFVGTHLADNTTNLTTTAVPNLTTIVGSNLTTIAASNLTTIAASNLTTIAASNLTTIAAPTATTGDGHGVTSTPDTGVAPVCAKSQGAKDALNFVFGKYKANANGTISGKEFDNLLLKLELGMVYVECTNCDKDKWDKKWKEEHGSGVKVLLKLPEKDKRRKRRSVKDEDEHDHSENEGEDEKTGHEKHEDHWKQHLEKCMNRSTMLTRHALPSAISYNISKADFIQLCPTLIAQLVDDSCKHDHTKHIESLGDHGGHGHDRLSTGEVWGYGLAAITVISSLSLAVIAVIPCLNKKYYNKVMAYLVALAVGTLCGDALLHLIPHAFADGATAAIKLTLTAEQQLAQHYSQVWRACAVLVGIYAFFCVEQGMKLKATLCGGSKGGHGHGHGGEQNHEHKEDEEVIKMKAGDDGEVTMALQDKEMTEFSSEADTHEVKVVVEGGGEHGHSHGTIDKTTKISSIAWMVIVGDGFHNFSDGMAVGVAFSASMSSGLSTAIAVFCHELPHELGDFAVLINNGMSVKQAVTYNLVSAVLAYAGLAVGIAAGSSEEGRHFILSITAGLFLYVSLADMLPELTHQELPKEGGCITFICQHLGIISGVGIMLVISVFEHAI